MISRFPLGLFEVRGLGHLIDETMSEDGGLVVYPQPWLPDALRRDLQLSRFDVTFPDGGNPEQGDEFRGIRDYRSGDPVKAIHWAATARSGALMVREWDPPTPRPQRYGLILHTLEQGGRLLRPHRWELALRIATGLTAHCRESGISLWFVAETGDENPCSLRIPERASFPTALERLALMPRTSLRDPAPLRRAIEKLGESCDRIYLLSDVPIEHWQKHATSHRCPLVCVDAESVRPQPRRMRVSSERNAEPITEVSSG